MNNIKQKIAILPKLPGVYLMKDKYANVIYVGKAKILKNRVSQYFLRKQTNQKVANMVENVFDFDFFVVHNELDALALENNLIKKYQPYYNILLKDGKNFAYIKLVRNDDFPHFEVTRKLDKKNRFFGPYFAGLRANDLLEIINYAYPIRKCKTKIMKNSASRKHCIFHDMHLCSAPCEKKIDKTEYEKIIDESIKFLKGDTKKVEKALQEKMECAATAENFETALAIRNKLNMLKKLKDKTVALLPQTVSYDVFAMAKLGSFSAICVMIIRGGKLIGVQTHTILQFLDENEAFLQFLMQYYDAHPYLCDEIILPKSVDISELQPYLENHFERKITLHQPEKNTKFKLLTMCQENALLDLKKNIEQTTKTFNESIGAIEQLKKDLNLKMLPKRIECYDISNTFGTNTVASMSVLINGLKAPKHYRKFKIETVDFIDDFSSMKEVLDRRFKRLNGDDESFSQMPDLIVIDGGKGQLSSAVEIANKYNYKNDIISLAKRLEEIFIPHQQDSIRLERSSYSLRLIQLVRDEAHRFAITFNRQLRSKSTYKGILEEIPNIGPSTRRILLAEFKTIENIKNANEEKLSQIKGVSKKQAKSIFEYFNKI